MRTVFWNVHKNKNINELICQLIIENDIDIIGLAEYEDDINDLIKKLFYIGKKYYEIIAIGCRRIHIISKYENSRIEPLYENSYFTMKLVPHRNLESLIMVFVHFQSKMFGSDDADKLDQANNLRVEIEKIEKELNIKRTIILGDFNMNPFENGMVAVNGLHTIPWAKHTKKIKRVLRDKDCYFFYNPMWNLFGDFNTPLGSYFYLSSNATCYYWNIYDQVCLRPEVIDQFKTESLKFLTQIDSTELIKKDVPDKTISDHLPLYFEL